MGRDITKATGLATRLVRSNGTDCSEVEPNGHELVHFPAYCLRSDAYGEHDIVLCAISLSGHDNVVTNFPKTKPTNHSFGHLLLRKPQGLSR